MVNKARRWLWRYSRWMLLLLLAACSQSVSTNQTPGPTQVPVTETPVPIPSRTPVDTAQPSPTMAPTATSTELPSPTLEPTPAGDLVFDFQDAGLVLPVGANGQFDDYAVWAPDVIFHEGSYHMFYTAFDNRSFNDSTIGYASSPDGVQWTKYAGNPILTGTEEFPKLQAPAVMVEGGQWIMYLDAGENNTPLNQYILRATASSPSGPWRLDSEPVFKGQVGNWDFLNQPVTFQRVEDTYYLFYSGVGGPAPQMGVALSADGINWQPYDDPATTKLPNMYSDPVLAVGAEESWEEGGVASYEVMYTDGVWEMFYIGFPEDPFERSSQDYSQPLQIGYATSLDGIHWEKYVGNPVFSSGERRWPLLDSIRLPDGRYRLYFDVDGGPGGLAMMEGTVQPRR